MLSMGMNEESEPEPSALQLKKEEEVGNAEKDAPNSSVEQPAAEPQEDVNLLNAYVWHTGAKPPADASKAAAAAGAGGQQGPMERPEKSKWSKMQSWRKALSEDPGDRGAGGGGGRGGGEEKAKPEKQGALRKNPFRRALSEPPGALLSVLSSSSSSAASPSASASASTGTGGEASGSNAHESAQKGKFMKYLQNVSRKIKRPRLQSRNSTPIIEHGKSSWLFKLVYESLPHHRGQLA